MSRIQFKLPNDLVTNLNKYTGEAGVARPLLLAELISDYLSNGLDESTESVAKEMKIVQTDVQPKQKLRWVKVDNISEENEIRLRAWAGDLAISMSALMEIIIHNRFSNKDQLQRIVDGLKAKGYQAQLAIPKSGTSEDTRIGVVALLSPKLRSAIERIEKLETRNTAQQIEYFLAEAVEKQDEFDKPLSKPPEKGSERKLVRVPRQVHSKLSAWSERKKRSMQNHILHILLKSVENIPSSDEN